MNPQTTLVLIIPGFSDAAIPGLGWQILWEAINLPYLIIEPLKWERPDLQEWVTRIDSVVTNSNQNVVLVAHGFGCGAVLHWVNNYPVNAKRIAGALLIEPTSSLFVGDSTVNAFGAMVYGSLLFPSIVVAHSWHGEFYAKRWGSQFVAVDKASSITTSRGFKAWVEGEILVHKLLASIKASDITRLFQELAVATWERLRDAQQLSCTQSEETITDINLLEISRARIKGVWVLKPDRHVEKKVGIDWFLCVGSAKGGWWYYAVQAKKLFLRKKSTKSGSVAPAYDSLSLGKKGRAQFDVLKQFAKDEEALGLYCLYNYVENYVKRVCQ